MNHKDFGFYHGNDQILSEFKLYSEVQNSYEGNKYYSQHHQQT